MEGAGRGLLGLVWGATVAISAGVVVRAPGGLVGILLGTGAALLLVRRRGMAFWATVALAFIGGQLVGSAEAQSRMVIARMAHEVPRCVVRGVVAEHADGL
ncbi:MAG: hypothetical protein M3198_11160, partial [Actinomycetota bacterium]|nr:hypothetical protein [Actinomycetota bacterium]